jgi:hypothetical protein
MHKRIKIGNIYIDFTYQYEDYFSEKIDAYQTNDLNHSFKTMTIDVQKQIEKPDRPITFTYKNRHKMAQVKDTYVMTLSDEGDIKHLIYYTNDYQNIKITLNQKIHERLAEFEYVISGMMFFEMALMEGYMPIHASCIYFDGHTFLLSGPSKSGKSTQTKYFIESYPSSKIINEDKPLIFFKDNKAYVIGSPWSGKHVINENIEKPLDYIFFINKAEKLSFHSLSRNEKMKQVFKNIHRPGDEVLVHQMMIIVNQMIDHLSIDQFNCINHPDSSKFLFKFMEGYREN